MTLHRRRGFGGWSKLDSEATGSIKIRKTIRKKLNDELNLENTLQIRSQTPKSYSIFEELEFFQQGLLLSLKFYITRPEGPIIADFNRIGKYYEPTANWSHIRQIKRKVYAFAQTLTLRLHRWGIAIFILPKEQFQSVAAHQCSVLEAFQKKRERKPKKSCQDLREDQLTSSDFSEHLTLYVQIIKFWWYVPACSKNWLSGKKIQHLGIWTENVNPGSTRCLLPLLQNLWSGDPNQSVYNLIEKIVFAP